MTLFRKVFQNQSRPAHAEEALDEEALRAAFKEMRETREPLALDPFRYVEEKAEQTAQEDPAPQHDPAPQQELVSQHDETAYEEDLLHPDEADPFAALAEGPDADFEAEMAALERELEAEASNEDEWVAETPDQGSAWPPAQTDEEIVANLGRALGATPERQEPLPDASDDALIEEDLDEIEMASSEPLEDVVETESGVDDVSLDGEEAARIDLSTHEATALFAREQMASLSQSPAPRPEDTALTGDFAPVADAADQLDLAAVAAPAVGRAGRKAGRAKTRVLGFNRGADAAYDPFGATPDATATPQREKYPVGWLVIVEGPGVGHAFSIFSGASMIGRGEDQMIRLDFGDNSISRNNHAAIAYDEEQNKFYVGHGGKSNIIRRNARPVLSTEELHHADLIRIGETTLRFVALCGSDFQWHTTED